MNLRQRTIVAMHNDIAGFEVKFKEDGWLYRAGSKFPKRGFIQWLLKQWMRFNTTLYPYVYVNSRRRWVEDPQGIARMLQHEWVHLKDAETLFGVSPIQLKWLNVALFYILYVTPQCLALLAVSAPIAVLAGAPSLHWLLLLLLLFAAPIPSPLRTLTELRGYRRSIELGGNVEGRVENFVDSSYYWMWPFRKWVEKHLRRPSPYKAMMDAV